MIPPVIWHPIPWLSFFCFVFCCYINIKTRTGVLLLQCLWVVVVVVVVVVCVQVSWFLISNKNPLLSWNGRFLRYRSNSCDCFDCLFFTLPVPLSTPLQLQKHLWFHRRFDRLKFEILEGETGDSMCGIVLDESRGNVSKVSAQFTSNIIIFECNGRSMCWYLTKTPRNWLFSMFCFAVYQHYSVYCR